MVFFPVALGVLLQVGVEALNSRIARGLVKVPCEASTGWLGE